MTVTRTFDQLLDDVQQMTPEVQAEFVALVQRRLAEQGRNRVIQDVNAARAEHADGTATVATVDDLMREIES